MLFAMSVSAQTNTVAEGYYRVKNHSSNRYMALLADTGWAHRQGTSIDANLYAIRTLRDTGVNHIESNPATIIHLQRSGSGYICSAQGTSTKQITSYTFNIRYVPGNQAYGLNSDGGTGIGNVTLYETVLTIPSKRTKDPVTGAITVVRGKTYDDSCLVAQKGNDEGVERLWDIIPVKSGTSCYMGFTPTFQSGDKYYQTFYADFPFKVVSNGLKVYTVYTIYQGNAVIKEFGAGETVPGGTPVLVECSSASASDNQVDVVSANVSAIKNNLLKGVYFNYRFVPIESLAKTITRRTAYNPSTMRVLRLNSEGKPAFVKLDNLTEPYYLPANRAYLQVPSSTAAELPLMTYDEYTAGIDDVRIDKKADDAVYTLGGVRVDATKQLPHGVYIVGGKKVVK